MKRLFASLLLAAALWPAQAATLQPDKSDLSFTFKQMGVPVDGKFKKFDAQLDFDAKKPEAGKIAFTVDLGSVSLGDASFDKPKWRRRPLVRHQAQRQGHLRLHRHQGRPGQGKLRRGGQADHQGRQFATSWCPSPLTGGVAQGSVPIKRLDFKIGDGEWADTSMVANDVTVKFKLSFAGL